MAKQYTATAAQLADALELQASCLLDEDTCPLGEYQPAGEAMATVLNQAAIIMRIFGSEHEFEEMT